MSEAIVEELEGAVASKERALAEASRRETALRAELDRERPKSAAATSVLARWPPPSPGKDAIVSSPHSHESSRAGVRASTNVNVDCSGIGGEPKEMSLQDVISVLQSARGGGSVAEGGEGGRGRGGRSTNLSGVALLGLLTGLQQGMAGAESEAHAWHRRVEAAEAAVEVHRDASERADVLAAELAEARDDAADAATDTARRVVHSQLVAQLAEGEAARITEELSRRVAENEALRSVVAEAREELEAQQQRSSERVDVLAAELAEARTVAADAATDTARRVAHSQSFAQSAEGEAARITEELSRRVAENEALRSVVVEAREELEAQQQRESRSGGEVHAAVVEGQLASCRDRLAAVESVLREWQAHSEALTVRLRASEANPKP